MSFNGRSHSAATVASSAACVTIAEDAPAIDAGAFVSVADTTDEADAGDIVDTRAIVIGAEDGAAETGM